MKSPIRTILILVFSILTIPSFSQSKDPNAKVKAMGLTEDDISDLCKAAQGKLPSYYEWGIHTVFEIIYDIEGKPYPEFESKQDALEFLRDIWERKYACVHCDFSADVNGSLDMMAIYHAEQMRFVYPLYSQNEIGANINIVRPYIISDTGNVYGTLLDYLNYITLKNPTGEMRKYTGMIDRFISISKKLSEDYGALNMSELSQEEIEQNKCK